MYPEEREYLVGPSGFVAMRDDKIARYEPGSRVWLRSVPTGADLSPTGRVRQYETKVVTSDGEPAIRRTRKRR